MCSERFRRFRRTKGYIVDREVRIEGLDSDKRSEVRLEVRSEVRLEIRSEVRIDEVLDLWLGAEVGEQANG